MKKSIALFSILLFANSVLAATSSATIEQRVEQLLSKMTLEQKIGQTALRGMSSRFKGVPPKHLKDAIRQGKVGAFLNVMNKDTVTELQRIAVEESPQGVPLLFGRDVIHGFKTIFPIPVGLAATWSPELAKQGARISAAEATTYGVRWTFAPMMDITRDARWGRIAETFGEDPYLASLFAAAMVKGFQGEDLSDPTSLAACAKHFAGYGAAEGGRDYNTTYIPEQQLRDIYLPPFKAAVDAGVASFMSAFNEINGVPATANHFLLTQVLRNEWRFDGFVVSDWNSVRETIVHGYAADDKHAAERSMLAGLDMEMVGKAYENNLAELVKQGKVDSALIDEAARRILRIKLRLGLFDKPYFDRDRDHIIQSKPYLAAAKRAAIESTVLLKNNNDILPLTKKQTIAVIGPLADQPHEQLGTWTFDGDKSTTQTIWPALQAFVNNQAKLNYEPALSYSRDKSQARFKQAIAAAKKSDVVLFIGGEEAIITGEAHSRANIRLPGVQEPLIKALHATGKPIVLLILAGRPISLYHILDQVDAVLIAWHPGTMGGPALVDLLYGVESPSGRLPVTWPKAAGQLPLYYNHKNTGRPANAETFVHIDDIKVGAWQSSLGNTSHYLDLGYTPQFPFGYGLSYTDFEYADLKLARRKLKVGEQLVASVRIKNTGKRAATETVQLYTQDLVGDITRPIRELKRFQRVQLKPGQSKKLSFKLDTNELSFHNQKMQRVVEPGEFNIWIGPNASEGLQAKFELVE